MKKCASCTKDLPDAALHCVFCGAKQPPAPATAGGMAKTVMGAYSASDMMDHLKQQGAAPPQNLPAAAPYRPSPAPPPPAYQPPHHGHPPPAPGASPRTPASAANAATMFVPGGPQSPPGPPSPGGFGGGGGPSPAGAFGVGGGPAPAGPAFGGAGPMSHPIGTSPSHASSVPLAAPPPPQPIAPVPSAAPPYLASQTAARAGRPIEPWKDSLRMMMFLWGGILLVAFAAPLSIDPLVFNWDVIANVEGTAKLPPLIMAAVGILSLAIAGIPMSPAPRGMIAGLLGLAGVLVPLLIVGVPPWQALVPLAGMIILLPSLFVRHEYRDASLPRILITVGVVASLVPYLVPQNGSLPLVQLFQFAIEAPGALKVIVFLLIAKIAITVLCLLAWMPSPGSGGAKVFAWLLILFPAILLVTGMILSGQISAVADTPAIVLSWVAGGGGGDKDAAAAMLGLGAGFGVAYAVLIGYGIATVVGKKLE